MRNPVNPDEVNALIGELLKRRRHARVAHPRTTAVKLGREPNLEVEVVC